MSYLWWISDCTEGFYGMQLLIFALSPTPVEVRMFMSNYTRFFILCICYYIYVLWSLYYSTAFIRCIDIISMNIWWNIDQILYLIPFFSERWDWTNWDILYSRQNRFFFTKLTPWAHKMYSMKDSSVFAISWTYYKQSEWWNHANV